MNIEYRLGTKSDLDNICVLIRDAVKEMERHEIYQWDDVYHRKSICAKLVSSQWL